MVNGDLEMVLSLYDAEAVFANQGGEVTRGPYALKAELAPIAEEKTRFDFNAKRVVETVDIALMHTQWSLSGTTPITVYAIEVARRQPDETWRWLIGDPYAVGRNSNE